MTIHASTWLVRRKWMLAVVGVPVLVALWWAFRPENLWIYQKVNEAAPFDTTCGPQPILTGRFEGEVAANRRARHLTQEAWRRGISSPEPISQPRTEAMFTSCLREAPIKSMAQDSGKDALDRIDLGPKGTNQGDQAYDLPRATDLNKYDAVLIYSQQSHAVFGVAETNPQRKD